MAPLRIGISACLLGDEVRYDGGHKRNRFLTETLGPHVEWVRVCPEVELGLGVPRETLHLVRVGGDVRMITTETAIDHTDAMRAWARRRVDALAAMNLRGYVLKSNSPSCGMGGVKVYGADGDSPSRTGVGLFANALKERFPILPIEEDHSLEDPAVRDNFIERVFAYDRLRALFQTRWTYADLVAFHAKHRLSLLAHSATAHRDLGRFLNEWRDRPRPDLQREYEARFMAALAKPATREGHTKILRHVARHLKRTLDAQSAQELAASIDEYRDGVSSFVVPVTLMRYHICTGPLEHLASQTYLEPDPRELMLRHHV